MSFLRRRTLIKGTLAGAGLIPASRILPSWAQNSGPIKIGLITPLSSSLAVVGKDAVLGANTAVESINKAGGVNGRQIELVIRDSRSNAQAGLAAAHDLLGQGVKLIGGPSENTANSLAETTAVSEANGVYINAGAVGMVTTHEGYNRCHFRAGNNDYQEMRALAENTIAKYPNVTDWAGISINFASMLGSYEVFKQILTEHYAKQGKKVTFADIIRTELGTSDFKQQISQIAASPAKGLFVGLYGTENVTFYQQATSFGLTRKMDLVVDRGQDVLGVKALKKNTPSNMWCVVAWYSGNFMNTRYGKELFEAGSKAANSKHIAQGLSYGHVVVTLYAQAIAAAGGSTDSDAVIKALESTTFDTCRGDLTFRKEDHQALSYVSLIGFGPADNEDGFQVIGNAAVSGKGVVEPATPGVAFKM